MRSLSCRSASTPPPGIKTILAVASARATIASHAVECVRSQAVHDTATACTKKLSQEMIEPSEYQRKLRSAKASPIPPGPDSRGAPARRAHPRHDATKGLGEALDVGFLRRPAEAEADRAARELRLHTHRRQHMRR